MKIITMLKTVATVILLATTITLSAQSGLSNMSFETWTTSFVGPTPVGWFGIEVSQQTTGAQQGSKYARLGQTATESGFLFLGDTTNMGAALAYNPASITGFYKTSGMQPGDVMSIQAITNKGNSTKAVASKSVGLNIATWTSFSVAFTVISPGAPDTINIFVINDPNNTIGAQFDVDNFAFNNGPVGIDERSIGTPFMIYPNPAKESLTIISKSESATDIIITDIVGKKVSELKINGDKTTIDVSAYKGGIYFYSILNPAGVAIYTSKFVVEK